jgi:DNA polymerase III subunit gamma/tau
VAYVSLYRKYRSQTFGDLIGQDHVVRTLQNGITSGRISHAYLFTGPRGTGKTSTARLLAKCLCCEKGPIAEPCNVCDMCVAITEGSCIDVVEMDAASQTGIDDVREKIIQVVDYMPAMARFKVFVIDEVHDLSTKAFDALLKTIEEPPDHMFFVLATTEYNKVPPTIRSRCQKFEFHRASIDNLLTRLDYVAKEEGVTVAPQALYAMARMADGGYRDALTLLEQAIISSGSSEITLQEIYDQLGLVSEDTTDKILEAILAADVPALTQVMAELTRVGRDPVSILESLLYRVADLTRIVYGIDSSTVMDASHRASSHDLGVRIGQEKLLQVRSALSEAHRVIREISLPRLWLESELIRISQLGKVIAKPVAQAAQASSVAPVREAPAKPVQPAVEVHAPKPEPEPMVEAAVETSQPESECEKLWRSALALLPGTAPIHLHLVDSNAVSLAGDLLVIELHRKSDYVWIMDTQKPMRLAHILKEVQRVGGEKLRIEFQVSKDGTRNSEPVAVELPAEGPKLAQMAREIFGS